MENLTSCSFVSSSFHVSKSNEKIFAEFFIPSPPPLLFLTFLILFVCKFQKYSTTTWNSIKKKLFINIQLYISSLVVVVVVVVVDHEIVL
jgi:hypothetical protein